MLSRESARRAAGSTIAIKQPGPNAAEEESSSVELDLLAGLAGPRGWLRVSVQLGRGLPQNGHAYGIQL